MAGLVFGNRPGRVPAAVNLGIGLQPKQQLRVITSR